MATSKTIKNNNTPKAGYVDGFVIPIPEKNFDAYKKMASEAGKIWKKFGALDYKECVGEDLSPKMQKGMKHQTFPKMAQVKRGETIWFSFIVYKSRAHRDAVNKKVMAYFEKKYAKENMSMPFDMDRFAYGGFKVIVSE